MAKLTTEHRDRIISLLAQGLELPADDRYLLFPPEKREYELVYADKERREDILAETLSVPFQEVRTFGVAPQIDGENLPDAGAGEWRNQLIFGDNLQAMKHLLDQKRAGKLLNADGTNGVRLIYIDPPFATKQEFRGSQDQKAYNDKIAGAQFVEFLRRRLIMMHEILADDGSIYLHLDTRKVHYMKVILDEVFGEENFINEIVWQRTNAHNMKSSYFMRVHDTVLLYSKSFNYVWNPQFTDMSSAQRSRYKVDENGLLYTGQDLTVSNSKRRDVWRGSQPSGNRGWALSLEDREKLWKDGLILKKRDGSPRLDGYKVFLDDSDGKRVIDLWTDVERVGNTSKERINYPTQKPEALLARILDASSNPGDIVLDGFMGSGTTLAVAEKLGRRWIGMDASKLAIYTTQKRLLNLRAQIGNKGPALEPRPFTLFNAGLYDFKTLKELPRAAWRFFALQLFGCRDELHHINGVRLDGTRQGAHVLVFDHHAQPRDRIDENTVRAWHAKLGDKVGHRVFIIAPRGVFDFQEDYIAVENVRYYALRIPYSFIEELHRRGFSTLRQPEAEKAVNELVDAVGFDFIEPPLVGYSAHLETPEREMFERATLQTLEFESRWRSKGQILTGGIETLSMLMLDLDYDGQIFNLGAVFYADGLKSAGWKATWEPEKMGERVAAIWVDIHGNESFKTLPRTDWGLEPLSDAALAARRGAPVHAVEVVTDQPAPDEAVDEATSDEVAPVALTIQTPEIPPAKAKRVRRSNQAA